MQPTRYRILEILKEQGDVTVAELARKLGMAPVSVRHHLDVLQAENLIWTPRVRRRGTVGRPQRVYALTDAADAHFPNNHQSLAVKMLDELKGVLPEAELRALFGRMADKMAGEAVELPQEASVEDRLDAAVEFLNDRGYLARWEHDGDSFLLFNLNCPYSGVADQHRELCQMDSRLMGQLTGFSLTPVTRMSQGDCRCAYRMNNAGDQQDKH